jgi:hypothetical protein
MFVQVSSVYVRLGKVGHVSSGYFRLGHVRSCYIILGQIKTS